MTQNEFEQLHAKLAMIEDNAWYDNKLSSTISSLVEVVTLLLYEIEQLQKDKK